MSKNLRHFFNHIDKVKPPNFVKNDLQYLNLVSNVLHNGNTRHGRNGKVISLFGEKMEFCLNNNKIPIITSKKLAWKTCLKELLWFINGDTNNALLRNNGVKIWNPNADLDFKEKNGIFYDNPDDLGPIYGHQWRHFNAKYNGCDESYDGKGIDQLQNIIDSLNDENERYSRRLIMSAWNPCQIPEMALPPCHVLSQFYVNDNKLSCALYQRSGDVGLGIPFNIASYGFLTCLLAKHCNLKPDKLIHFIGDAHIYENHKEQLKKQLDNPIFNSPTLEIAKQNSIDDYTIKDFDVKNYNYNKKIKMDMIA